MTRLEPYTAFHGWLPRVESRHSDAIIQGIVDIVTVEGPVVASRIYSAYAQSAGERQLNAQKAQLLVYGTRLAVRQGSIRTSDLGVEGTAAYVVDRERQCARVLGPRHMHELPLGELVRVIDRVEREQPAASDAQLMEISLVALGHVKRSADSDAMFRLAHRLRERHPELSAPEVDRQLLGEGLASPAPNDSHVATIVLTDAADHLAGALLGSAQFLRQRAAAGRAAPPDSVTRAVIAGLLSAHGRASISNLSVASGVGPSELRRAFQGLRRLLNIDGYDVITIDESGAARLTVELLVEQFELPSLPDS